MGDARKAIESSALRLQIAIESSALRLQKVLRLRLYNRL